ncbi:ATP-binding protein [Pseudorhodoferax sp. Leaf267]|uniref:sensor histidine kinase n=1 Tax=Pseudorhodoferax sp. Leaf267 TaxID=1736316 RepID=UPI0006FAA95C|nr:ATP-binding protein [Pseudorhodoferax sp. Leaf267]KQP18359.1 hypothetical protein ASF43_11145 [Pseudorhodoferax sp. Leaf267]
MKSAARPGLQAAARSVPRRTWLLLSASLLVLALGCAVLIHRETLRGLALAVRHANAQLADQVDRSHGELTGAMVVQGLLDRDLKDVLAGTRQPDAALYQGFSTVIRQFALDNMQVVDAQGTTVAYVDKAGRHDSLGSNRTVRAFVDRGMAGLTSRDPMIGRSSGVRGIYVAAPVRADRSPSAPVAGIVVVRIGLGSVDRLLQQQRDPAMLLSPDGLVYATNRADWAMKLAEPLSDERLQALRRSQQFGKLLATSRPDELPFVFSPGTARLDGRHYDLAEERLAWADEGRGWRLLLLRERGFAAEWGAALAGGGGVLLAGALAALVWLRRQARRMAAEQQQAAVRADLQAREQQLQHVLESAPGAVIVTGAGAELLFHNRHALELHGERVRDVRTLYVDPAAGAALSDAVRRDGHAQSQAVQMLRGDGSPFWAQVTLSRGQFAGHPDAIFGWAVDVTEARQAAEAMRRAKEAAEAVAATKSAFLANVSHEIRTPMNAIIGLAHLALQTTLTAQQREHIQKVYNAARALLRVVTDILDFSRMEAGKLVIEQADFDLDELLGQVATQAGEQAASKGLALAFEVDAAVPRQLHGDAPRLAQVLANLLSNAVKFTATGRVTVQVALAPQPPGHDGMALDIAVSDTGIGMGAEQLARLFTPFSQADESTTRRFGGTGLGLSICKRLVDAAGGEIAVVSTPGEGSCFRVRWPCTRAEMQRPAGTELFPAGASVDKSVEAAVDAATNGRVALEDPAGALQRLRDMLEAMDGDANDQLAAMAPWLAWQLSPPEWVALQAHVRNYDYDEALAVLRAAPGLVVKAEPV